MPAEAGRWRIGELSRRVKVSAATLRAWERRYGLLAPERSPSGYRLYGSDDEARVLHMRELQRRGFAAAEAARLARSRVEQEQVDSAADALGDEALHDLCIRLVTQLEGFDEAGAQATLDRVLTAVRLETALDSLVLPAMREIGRRWECSEVTVGQEHFATAVVHGRMLALARGWDQGLGPRALLACPAGEQHCLGVIAMGLALRQQGWRVAYIGADAPADGIAHAISTLSPAIAVLAAFRSKPFLDGARELRAASSATRILIGGPGASPAIARRLGADHTPAGPTQAAQDVTEWVAAKRGG
jgi:DNA-binding transcriptional MerR regulator